MYAVMAKNEEVVQLLLERGSVDVRFDFGMVRTFLQLNCVLYAAYLAGRILCMYVVRYATAHL